MRQTVDHFPLAAMVSTGSGRRGARWRRAQAQCMANGEANGAPCCLCHLPIDYEFTRYYPLHSMAGTAHHELTLLPFLPQSRLVRETTATRSGKAGDLATGCG